jgi:hypothetical protein
MSGRSGSSYGGMSSRSGSGYGSSYGSSSYGGRGGNNQGSRGYGSYGQGMTGSSSTGEVRTRMEIAFEPVAPRSAAAMAPAAARVQEVMQKRGVPGVRLEMRGDTAVLRGVVATTRDRALAEQFVRLEPGIANVQNDLVVAAQGSSTPAPSSSTTLPPPSSAAPPAASAPASLPASSAK